jgi:hypothetical protein
MTILLPLTFAFRSDDSAGDLGGQPAIINGALPAKIERRAKTAFVRVILMPIATSRTPAFTPDTKLSSPSSYGKQRDSP